MAWLIIICLVVALALALWPGAGSANRWVLGANPADTPQLARRRLLIAAVGAGSAAQNPEVLPLETGGELGRVRRPGIISIAGRRSSRKGGRSGR